MGSLRPIAIASLFMCGCPGRAGPGPAVDVPAAAPLVFGAALPTLVVAADPEARWAVLCQAEYALMDENDTLYAVDLVHEGRWIVEGARAWDVAEFYVEPPVLFAAGGMVALRDEVIEPSAHRLVSAGEWVIHGVWEDGSALVISTTDEDWLQGPLRKVPPGTFERNAAVHEEE